MKKFYVLIVALIIGATASVSAMDFKSYPDAFKKGSLALNAGIGLGTPYAYGTGGIPPLSVSVDYALPIADLPLSFGALFGFSTSSYRYSGYGWDFTNICIGVRGAYHFDFDVKGLDTYAGIMIGYNIVTTTEIGTPTGYAPSASALAWGGYIGARYFFIPNVGAFAELGYSFSYATLGVTVKI